MDQLLDAVPPARIDDILAVPITVAPKCSGQPPFMAAPTWITVVAPATARSTAAGSPRLPKQYSMPSSGRSGTRRTNARTFLPSSPPDGATTAEPTEPEAPVTRYVPLATAETGPRSPRARPLRSERPSPPSARPRRRLAPPRAVTHRRSSAGRNRRRGLAAPDTPATCLLANFQTPIGTSTNGWTESDSALTSRSAASGSGVDAALAVEHGEQVDPQHARCRG